MQIMRMLFKLNSYIHCTDKIQKVFDCLTGRLKILDFLFLKKKIEIPCLDRQVFLSIKLAGSNIIDIF